MKGKKLALLGRLLLGGVLMLAVWMLLVWVSSRPALKTLIDLTPHRVNSVDPVTEELLRDLRAQSAAIEFHLFAPPWQGQGQNDFARQSLAIRHSLVEQTKLLLRRYEYLGAESVKLVEYDFSRDAAAARDAAMAFDYKVQEGETLVVAIAMPGKERRFRKLSLVSDLAVIDLPQTGGAPQQSRGALPVLRDYRGEEGISSSLKSLLVQGTPVAYLLRGYDQLVDFSSAADVGYRAFLDALDRVGFEIRQLNLAETQTVPPDATVVIVLTPRGEFTDKHSTALFDYVQHGGRVFISYGWSAGVPDWNQTGGKLGEMLGYELSSAPVFHLIPGTSRTAGRGIHGDAGVMKLQMLLNKDHPTTRRLAENVRPLELWGAREVRQRAGAPENVERTPLLQTHAEGWLAVPNQMGQIDYSPPQGIRLRAFTVGMAFEVPQVGDSSADSRPGQVVVIGGEFCNNAGMHAGFGDLAINICNWMAERRVLLDIRGSRYESRNLVVQQSQLDRTRVLLVYGVPCVFLVLGAVVFFLRRRQ